MAKRIPWNKGMKGRQPWHNTSGLKRGGWNKGLPMWWNSGRRFKKGHIPWNKGLTKETDERVKLYALKGSVNRKGQIAWNKGKKCPQWSGEKHWNWKGGKSKEGILRHCLEYRQWQQSVYRKNNWTCRLCGIHPQKSNIIAHHIFPFSDFPEERFKIENGIVLCRRCHKLLHSLSINDVLYGNIITHKIYVKRENENKIKEAIKV